MEARSRTRSVQRGRLPAESQPRQRRLQKQMVIPMTRAEYDADWTDAAKVRMRLEALFAESPELFPVGFSAGFSLEGLLRESRKQPGIRLRKLLVGGSTYTLRPSFLMPYLSGTVDDCEAPLLLLSFGVPCWVITRIFDRNDQYWHRQLERLGRNSLVGTTVKQPGRLPADLVADEHHVDWRGEKGFIATTAGGGCLLGVALTESADETHLTEAYGDFAAEAKDVFPKYAPRTVNTDGWWATQNAFQALFSGIVVVLCFLHGCLKIRDRCRKNFALLRDVWHVYRAATAAEFRERMRQLQESCSQLTLPTVVTQMLEKLYHRTESYAAAYDHPGCHRTSNQVDRLMNRMKRLLYAGRGLHGHRAHSERRLRGWALLLNFRPFAPRSNHKRDHQSPAHRLNQKAYHDNWLHNLNVCASMLGRKSGAPAKC